MEKEQWDYKIGNSLQDLIPQLLLLAVFGGVTIWLRIANNGAYIFGVFLTIIMLVVMACWFYRFIFVKVLIGKDGFFHQTKPGNGTYYRYEEITEAWESAGKTLSNTGHYCSFRTADGQVTKFVFLPCDFDGIEFFLTRINKEENKVDREDQYE